MKHYYSLVLPFQFWKLKMLCALLSIVSVSSFLLSCQRGETIPTEQCLMEFCVSHMMLGLFLKLYY